MKDYFLGLDIGTNSVGWAVTDKNYNLHEFRRKAMWGSHTFEEGQNAAETRKFRAARRRNNRKQQRIAILQSLFNEEVSNIDPAFFIRLEESFLKREDRKLDCRFSLFNDENYTDADYHRDYPTIHHLINSLASGEAPKDVRLLYLAVSYIMSHRGHFLLNNIDGDSIEEVKAFEPIYAEFKSYLEIQTDLDFNVNDIEKFKAIISNRELGIKQKERELDKLVSGENEQKTQRKAILTLISGGSVEIKKIFNNDNYAEIEPKSIMLKGDFEAIEAAVAADLGDDFEFIERMKSIYDWSVLSGVLREKESISAAKEEAFEEYGEDLKKLKNIIKTYIPEKYSEVFWEKPDKGLKNYVAYTGSAWVDCKKRNLPSELRATQEEFYKYIKPILENIKTEEGVSDIRDKIDAGAFLSKQKTSDNGAIPYQLYYHELKNILDNAEKIFSFLLSKDEKGISVKDKILKLFEHRIPYYVGPLSRDSKWGWLTRDNNEKIYPWNFEEVVDLAATREEFIRKMSCKCTYLHKEDVIPKNSLLYSEYEVLNEINKIKIMVDGKDEMTVDIKTRILNALFKNEKKKVTAKRIRDFLLKENIIGGEVELAGFDIEAGIKSTLKSYHDFKKLFTSGVLSNDDAEEIIKYITLFGDEKKVLRQWISNRYPQISAADVKYILGLKYKDWGRFSEKLLKEIPVTDMETGECWNNIITAMRETNYNFMELAEGKSFNAIKQIEELNKGEDEKSLNEFLDDRYISNAVKRQITRALAVVEEVEKAMGAPPKRIFIEMARGGGTKGKRTKSRKRQVFDDLYKYCQKEAEQYLDDNYSKLKNIEESKFQSDKLFLYCLQFGRCMYSGERIDLDELLGGNSRWDIDHIYPQSKVKDDSLDNRVLVNKRINANKSSGLLSGEIQSKMSGFWESLKRKSNKLISNEKYLRLTRTSDFDDKELEGFIARQLVETRQSAKALREWLEKRKFPESKVVSVKAGLVSEFRQEVIGMMKCREINDFHHAKDAYLNIVVGNVYDTRFGNTHRFVKENREKNYNIQIKKMCGEYDYNKDDGLRCKTNKNGNKKIGIDINNAWQKGEKGTVNAVMKTILKNNVLSTRYTFERKGGYFNQQPVPAGRGQHEIKKGLDIAEYGGYTDLTATYFILVKHTEKGKTYISIKPIDLIHAQNLEDDAKSLQKYCENQLRLKNSEIMRKIKINAVLSLDGARVAVASKSNGGETIVLGSTMQLILDYEKEAHIRIISSIVKKKKDFEKSNRGKAYVISSKFYENYPCLEEFNKELYDMLTEKISNNSYSKILKSQIKTLESGREIFLAASVPEQCESLLNIVSLFNCGRTTGCNLKMIGGSGQGGVITLNSCLSKTKYKSIKIIDQSDTGLFERIWSYNGVTNLLELCGE